MPKEGYIKCKEEDGDNEEWFEKRWGKKNGSLYVKHTLHKRCFYRKSGRDDTIVLEMPQEGYIKCKEEDGDNEEWFEERWKKNSLHNDDNKKPWLKWEL